MGPTRKRDLVGAAVAAALLSYLLIHADRKSVV